MTDFDVVRDAVAWHEYGSQDERRRRALPALDRIEAEYRSMSEQLTSLAREGHYATEADMSTGVFTAGSAGAARFVADSEGTR